MHFCASKNNIDVARMLLTHKASTRTKDKQAQLPIHRAAAIGSVPMVKLLIENKSPINAADISGLTPLHHGEPSPGDSSPYYSSFPGTDGFWQPFPRGTEILRFSS